MRHFVLGSNDTGSVEVSGNSTVVNGGENPTLEQVAIPGQEGIVYGSTAIEGTTQWPEATVAAFASHVGQVEVTGTDSIAPSPTATATKGHSGALTDRYLAEQRVALAVVLSIATLAHLL